jgi:hypothetical protein
VTLFAFAISLIFHPSIRDAKNGASRHAFLNAEIHSMLFRRYKEQAKADYVFPAEGGKLREWVPDTFAGLLRRWE